jgi:hypothetical protein
VIQRGMVLAQTKVYGFEPGFFHRNLSRIVDGVNDREGLPRVGVKNPKK